MRRADVPVGEPIAARVVHKSFLVDQPGSRTVIKLMLNLEPGGREFAPGEDIAFLPPGVDAGPGHKLRFYTIEAVGAVPFESSVDITVYVGDHGHHGDVSTLPTLMDLEVGASVTVFGPFPYPFYPPMGSRSNVILIGAGGGVVPFRWLARKIQFRGLDWMGKVLMLEGRETGLEQVYQNLPGQDQDQYFDAATYRAFEALKTRYSAVAVDRTGSERANRDALWRLMGQGSVYVYRAGYRAIADAMDDEMERHLRLAGRWMEAKAALERDGHWLEWLYD